MIATKAEVATTDVAQQSIVTAPDPTAIVPEPAVTEPATVTEPTTVTEAAAAVIRASSGTADVSTTAVLRSTPSASSRWYVVTRGTRVGVIQGWYGMV